jgi:hypothetical protein
MIRFKIEASMTRRGEEIHKDNFNLVPIIKEYTREKREGGRGTTIEQVIMKINSD